MITIVSSLIDFWKSQSITSGSKSLKEIKEFEAIKGIVLPGDFVIYYSNVNGMETYYPNYIDNEGFLFYPLEGVVTLKEEFNISENPILNKKNEVLIFAEYMHKSWWYGVEIDSNNQNYVIGIIPYEGRFEPITSSLSEFIALYLEDSSKLY